MQAKKSNPQITGTTAATEIKSLESRSSSDMSTSIGVISIVPELIVLFLDESVVNAPTLYVLVHININLS